MSLLAQIRILTSIDSIDNRTIETSQTSPNRKSQNNTRPDFISPTVLPHSLPTQFCQILRCLFEQLSRQSTALCIQITSHDTSNLYSLCRHQRPPLKYLLLLGRPLSPQITFQAEHHDWHFLVEVVVHIQQRFPAYRQ